MAHAEKKSFREDCRLPAEGWSNWMKAMVPTRTTSSENRGAGQEGFKLNTANALNKVVGRCGIYEWRAIRADQSNRVVYVGSTCTRNGDFPRLQNRILGYCTNGNHKKDLINDALKKEYVLEVRYKEAKNEKDAREQENKLLDKYDYAWNIRRNGSVRQILPKQPRK